MKPHVLPCFALLLSLTFLTSCQGEAKPSFDTGNNIEVPGYNLKQVTVLSRHHIRAPLSAPGSLLERLTPYKWYSWSSNASELSLRGGILETEMGQYFRKWLEKEELFPDNYHPSEEEVRIYANAKQRTIATAEYFVSGLLPSANFPIEVNAPYDTMDPVFNPQLTFMSPTYAEAAKKEMMANFGQDIENLKDEYALLSDVLDFSHSKAYLDKEVGDFVTDDVALSLEVNKEPAVKGSLKTACTAADALVLQYYEEPDESKAAFGKKLSFEQWQAISRIKDTYGDLLFASPLVAHNVAKPLLETIESELSSSRRFSYLCGHDSNLSSVLASLGVEDYVLPGSVESKTPIGAKLVLSTYVNQDKQEYLRADMVYQNVECLRNMPLLDLESHPSIVPLRFKGIEVLKDGLYEKEDFLSHLHQSIAKYDKMVKTYHESSAFLA